MSWTWAECRSSKIRPARSCAYGKPKSISARAS
jgi:hypothetical protein